MWGLVSGGRAPWEPGGRFCRSLARQWLGLGLRERECEWVGDIFRLRIEASGLIEGGGGSDGEVGDYLCEDTAQPPSLPGPPDVGGLCLQVTWLLLHSKQFHGA